MSSERPATPIATSAPRQKTRRALRGVLAWASRVALALLMIAGVFFSVIPAGRSAARAALLLPALVTGAEPPPLIAVGDPFHHTQTVISSQDGPVYLDIYAPTAPPPPVPGAREGLLLIPGVGDNRTVPQLVNLAQSLARTGVVAMAMTTNSLINYELAPATADGVVQATLALERYPGVGRGRVGIIGFSAGGSLACIAAADPRIRDSLAFVTSFGGYYDARMMLRDLGRRALDVDGKLQPWRPDPVPVQTLASTVIPTLSASDAALLRSGFNLATGVELSPADQVRLSPVGLAVYHLLTGDEPDRVDANMAALSPELRTLLDALSPRTYLANVRAPIYLLHDQSDIYVPFTESRDFAAALTRVGHAHRFVEFSIFAHVEVKSGLGAGQLIHDGWSLYLTLIATLAPGA